MVISTLLLLSSGAHAYDTIGAAWPAEAFPIPYTVHVELEGVDEDETLAAIEEAFATWEAVDCVELSFSYEGRSEATWGEVDGENTIFVIASGWPEDAALLSAPQVVTAGSEIVEADLALNAESYAWSADGADGIAVFDIQGAMTHEIGHLLGLWHSDVTGATLNPVMDGHPDACTLEDDDIAGICEVYADLTPPGEGEVGDACGDHTDCLSELCLADGADSYCSTTCESTTDCPDGWECLTADRQQVCAVAVAEEGCACGAPVAPGWLAFLVAPLALLRRRG